MKKWTCEEVRLRLRDGLHPECMKWGCQSEDHFICPVECDLKREEDDLPNPEGTD